MLDGMDTRWWRRKKWMWVWGVLSALAGFAAVGAALWRLPWWLDAHYLPTLRQPQATAVTGMRTALLAMAAGGLAAVGVVYTHRTWQQNREAHVTDRYTKAIGQIASDKPVEQLGGIYALERIMRDSTKDQPTIVAVLAAFVREHAPAPGAPTLHGRMRLTLHRLRAATPGASAPNGHARAAAERPHPTEPVQAALIVISRRPRDRNESLPLNLVRTDLRGGLLWGRQEGATYRGARLEGAFLMWTRMEGVVLYRANLEEAQLNGAHLEQAMLMKANLQRASLQSANLEGADLRDANLVWASLWKAQLDGAQLYGANLEQADLHGTNLEGARGLTVEQVVSARPDSSTRLPADLAADARVMARMTAVERERDENSSVKTE
ncbi:pentapeptide repeat-containing protein [Streptomyces chartreusis]|uniref:pentapeptide repeat-containing protein n=1 Tax=Streptomyces chartreusis TaxID=1969 RepID=UPI0036A087BE